MPDIKIVFDPLTFEADYQLGDGVLRSDLELATSVTLALGTDRRAEPDDVIPDGSNDRRGCWADEQSEEIWKCGPWGSRLWLLKRRRADEETRTLAEFYINEALEWYLRPENRLASEIIVETKYHGPAHNRALLALATFIRPDRDPLTLRYDRIWQEIEAA